MNTELKKLIYFLVKRDENGVASPVGWDKLDQWAKLNNPIWKCLSRKCDHAGMPEIDRLKILSAHFLDLYIAQRRELMKLYEKGLYPAITTDNKNNKQGENKDGL